MVIKLSVRGGRPTADEANGRSKAAPAIPKKSERRNLAVELPTDFPTEHEAVRVRSQPAEPLVASRQALPAGIKALPTGEEAPPSYNTTVEHDGTVLGRKAPAHANSISMNEEDPPSYDDAEENDEAVWDLDEATEEQVRQGLSWTRADVSTGDVPYGATEKKAHVDSIVHSFLEKHPCSPEPKHTAELDCPVIIPQRRPGNRRRGFVHAYAPALADCGIDETAFSHFLKDLYRASQASRTLYAVDAGALIAGLIPEMTAAMTAGMVRAAARTAIEVQTRQRTNSFLGQMNESFFKPRGLFCMIMTNRPQREAPAEPLDISQSIAKFSVPAETKMKRQLRNLRTSNGIICGEVEVPAAAPLVFPEIDAAAGIEGSDGTKQNPLKKSSKVISNYIEKRSQAIDTKRTVKTQRKEAKRAQKDLEKACKDEQKGRSVKKTKPRQKGVKRMLKQDVLYLMVVNMPREEELEAARLALTSEEKAG